MQFDDRQIAETLGVQLDTCPQPADKQQSVENWRETLTEVHRQRHGSPNWLGLRCQKVEYTENSI